MRCSLNVPGTCRSKRAPMASDRPAGHVKCRAHGLHAGWCWLALGEHLFHESKQAINADPRAATVLQQGYELLQETAASLDDEIRHHFLEAVPSHRALVMAYHAWRLQEDQQRAGLAVRCS